MRCSVGHVRAAHVFTSLLRRARGRDMAMAAARERAAPRSFECALCGWATLHVDYFGRKPPFNKSIVYLEDCFVIQDPIGDPMRPVCVGSVCVVCERQGCIWLHVFISSQPLRAVQAFCFNPFLEAV